MKKKLVIATVAMVLSFSSAISVAGLRAFVRDMSRADYIRSLAYEQARAEYALAQQAQEPAPVEEPARAPGAQPTAPRRGGRGVRPPTGAPGPESQPTISSDTQRYEDQFSEFDVELWRRSRDAVRLGQDLTVAPGDVVREATVVFGNATIAGRVTGDLRVFFGTARILSTAIIDGDFITVGGGVNVQPGATARRDVVVVGGPLDAPAGFVAGGQQVVIGSGLLGGWLDAAVPYLSRGLLWGRVIVPGLPWIWGIVALFFLLYAALNLIFDRPVRACALTMRNRPLTTFGAGLLVLLLIGPVCVLLAFSIIGIAVVPFVICAAVAGAIIGKVAVARCIGMTAVEEDPDGNRAHAARSFIIGFAVLTIGYMIPVLGVITWAIVGVLGLGSAWLTFMAAYRRENPAKPPAVVPQPPMPPVASPPAPVYSFATPAADASSTAFDGTAGAAPIAPPPYQAPPTPPPGGYAAYAAGAYGSAASGLLVAQPRALFRDRLAAFIVDVVVIFISVAFLDAIGIVDTPASFFPLLLIYFIVFWTWRQTTFGGIVCQIRLVKTDGTPLNFADSLVRGLAGIFSLGVFAIGALWILRDPEQQAWHDKIAGTYVVKVPRNFPL